ncbi:MAG: NosD domain-containing protein, partial [Candidatus Thorarchaeota archaeon]
MPARVSRCFLSLTLFMFLLALTPVADLDGIATQPVMLVSEPEKQGILPAGTPHDPIVIWGDANFSATALLEGWPGDGSPENPFIIDGLDIDLGGETGNCIIIWDTRVSFTISNCKLTGAEGYFLGDGFLGSGILLYNVAKGELVNNIVNSNAQGIFLMYSTSNSLVNNTCNSNNIGIELEESGYNTMANNTCSDNAIAGILLDSSHYNTVTNNICSNNTDCGIYLY